MCAEDEEEKVQQRVNMMSPSKNVLQTPGFKSGLLSALYETWDWTMVDFISCMFLKNKRNSIFLVNVISQDLKTAWISNFACKQYVVGLDAH